MIAISACFDVFITSAGWAIILAGIAVGFLFAALVLCHSLVSFPMLIDFSPD